MKRYQKIFLWGLLLLLPVWCHAIGNKPIRVACIGNSITYGSGMNDPATQSYPARLQKLLGSDYLVANFGKPGATLLRRGHRPYMQQKEFRNAMKFPADVVVIHLGVNDTDPRDWPNYRDDFVGDYLTLIDSLRSISPKARFLIALLTPLADRHPRFQSGTKEWHDQIQVSIRQVARLSGSELIDFHSPLYAHPDWLPDAVHPNEEGYQALAQTVFSAITGQYGGLQLPPIYSDNMVLQMGEPLRIQGKADTGEKVTVSIANIKKTAVADVQGHWEVLLPALKTSGEGYELKVATRKRTLLFHNVAIGEVWLCSGQSNMQFMLTAASTAQRDIPTSDDSGLRLFNMSGIWDTGNFEWSPSAIDSVNHLLYYKNTTWQPASPQSVTYFSAIAYYFGKKLRQELKVPVGLVCNAVGGSGIEAWIDRQTLETKFPALLCDWLNNDFIQGWVRQRAALNIKQAPSPRSRHPYEPCYLFEAGIQPLQQFPIRGVVWYQGESNAHNVEAHERLFPLLLESWRGYWNRAELPFYYVQLSSLNRPSWPWFRDSQRRLMQCAPALGMAVSSDLGDSLDVHPHQKQPIGERLAAWALNQTYHLPVVPSGPLFKEALLQGQQVVLSFDYAESLTTRDGHSPCCFELAEEDGLFYPAEARIKGTQVWLQTSQLTHPRWVRYAWQPFTRANLINGTGFPASTFRAEVKTK